MQHKFWGNNLKGSTVKINISLSHIKQNYVYDDCNNVGFRANGTFSW